MGYDCSRHYAIEALTGKLPFYNSPLIPNTPNKIDNASIPPPAIHASRVSFLSLYLSVSFLVRFVLTL